MKYIILDIDNCISNDGWRIPKIDWEIQDNYWRFATYHSLGWADLPGNSDLLFTGDEKIILCTSRPEPFRAPTLRWFWKHGVLHRIHHLYMRGRYEYDTSLKVKSRQLTEILLSGIKVSDIVCAYDDRADIIAMYKENGINAERRWIHSVSAYRGIENEENA